MKPFLVVTGYEKSSFCLVMHRFTTKNHVMKVFGKSVRKDFVVKKIKVVFCLAVRKEIAAILNSLSQKI